MAEFRPGTAEQPAFRAALAEAGLIFETAAPGVYGWGSEFEAARNAVAAVIERATEGQPEQLVFPPLVPRSQIEDLDYLRSFPHLAGAIFSFDGDEAAADRLAGAAAAHGDWPELSQTELVLTPASCYPVYPVIAARGPLAEGGANVVLAHGAVFRNEPSSDPARLSFFHQYEMVRIADPDTVRGWRDGWRDRAVEILTGLGLAAEADLASDPFFGRAGKMLARGQRGQELKFEVVVPIAGEVPTAVASFNYHQDHFAKKHGIVGAGGGEVHSACLGFGLERIVLALFWAHGLDSAAWPAAVRSVLWSDDG